MTVTLKHNPKFETGESKRKTIVDEFFIDEGRCMRCNICAEVCPTNFRAITLTGSSWLTNEMAVYDRTNLVLDLDQLVAASSAGYSINPLTPEQNQLAPAGSRAWKWAQPVTVNPTERQQRKDSLFERLFTWFGASARSKRPEPDLGPPKQTRRMPSER
jgi:formate hydrogenlyase subunit 6/NADH:ubiquinone oxidoreductase subunit I